MAYSTGMMNKRVKVAKRHVDPDSADNFGKSGQSKYEWVNPNGDHAFWCGVTFDKGMKSLREGALDSYITKMFRFRYHDNMDEWCLLQYRGKWFQIHSFNDDFQDNTIQITAVSMANQQVNIVEPTPDPEPTSNAGATDEGGESGAVNPEPQNDGTINDNDNDSNS